MSDPTRDPATIIDPIEERIHRLYRERIVQEDNLINHRMMWMVLSQAFMLALYAGFFKETSSFSLIKSVIFVWPICTFGFVFAYGSKMAISAAQAEINELREVYLLFYPRPIENDDDQKILGLDWLKYVEFRIFPQRSAGTSTLTPEEKQLKIIPKTSDRTDILPRLTGKKFFHKAGHLLPSGMPVFLMGLWIFLATVVPFR